MIIMCLHTIIICRLGGCCPFLHRNYDYDGFCYYCVDRDRGPRVPGSDCPFNVKSVYEGPLCDPCLIMWKKSRLWSPIMDANTGSGYYTNIIRVYLRFTPQKCSLNIPTVFHVSLYPTYNNFAPCKERERITDKYNKVVGTYNNIYSTIIIIVKF